MSYETRFQRLLDTAGKGDKHGAFFQLLRLATEGHQDRYVEVGLVYERGWGKVEADLDRAISWYEKAAWEAHDQEGFLALGRLHYFGIGVEQDHEKALWYYELLVTAGNPIAHYVAGTMYLRGVGTQQDRLKARDLFEKGAALGNIPCSKVLALFAGSEGSLLECARLGVRAWAWGFWLRAVRPYDERLRTS